MPSTSRADGATEAASGATTSGDHDPSGAVTTGGTGVEGGTQGGSADTENSDSDGSGEAPSTHFSAQHLQWRVPAPGEIPESPTAQVYFVAQAYYSLFDLNGDGRPDLVFSGTLQQNGMPSGVTPGAGMADPHWNVHWNTGTGFATEALAWRVGSPSFHMPTSFVGKAYWTTLDIDGDGLVDFVETSDPEVTGDPQPWDAGTGTPHWRVYRNDGRGFASSPSLWRVPGPGEIEGSNTAQVYAVAQTYYSLFDIDGDRRPDLVFTSGRRDDGSVTGTTPGAGTGQPHWSVHLNEGNGFAPEPVSWSVPSESHHVAAGVVGVAYWATVDLDGDGRVDFVETSDPEVAGDPQPWGAATREPYWKLYRNDGQGFSRSSSPWRVPSPMEIDESSSAQVYAVAQPYVALFDIEGDGRPDLVFTSVRQDNGAVTGTTPGTDAGSAHWNVHRNTGAGFAPTSGSWPVRMDVYHPATGSRDRTYWATLDINGDGRVDFIETSDPAVSGDPQPWGARGANPYWRVFVGEPDD